MPVIPNNTLRVRLFVGTPRGQWSSTLYYEPAVPLLGSHDMLELANGIQDFFESPVSNCLVENATFDGVYVRYKSATVDIEGFSNTAPTDGSINGDELPDQDCAEIRRLTGKPGREKRGRIFLSGMSSNVQTDGVWSDDFIITLGVLAAAIAQDLTLGGDTYHARHWDRKNNVMEVVTSAKVLKRAVSRRDRAKRIPYHAV